MDVMQVLGTIAKLCNGQDATRLRVDDADPRHRHMTENDGDAADFLKQSVLVLAAHDGFVALAKRGIEIGQTLEFGLYLLALRDVACEHDKARFLAVYRGLAGNGSFEPVRPVRDV